MVSRRCAEIVLTRKQSSKESYNNFSVASLQKLQWLHTEPPPLGIRGISTTSFIDIDETGFYLKSCVKNYSRSHKTIRARYPSRYTRKEPKVNLIMAVESGNTSLPPHVLGSAHRPR